MLKGIPKVLSPELLKVLCEMGHSDRIVLADGNFPAQSMGKNAIVIRADGHGTCELLVAQHFGKRTVSDHTSARKSEKKIVHLLIEVHFPFHILYLFSHLYQ